MPGLVMSSPVVFENYNRVGCMGFGLKNLQPIKQDDIILKMKTEMGLVSTQFIEGMEDDEDKSSEENRYFDKMIEDIKDHTMQVALKNTNNGAEPTRTNQIF